MKLTLKQKREIVGKFKLGWSILGIAQAKNIFTLEIEFIIRDYLNGEFKLEAKHEGS